jgi:hypothetical protein
MDGNAFGYIQRALLLMKAHYFVDTVDANMFLRENYPMN